MAATTLAAHKKAARPSIRDRGFMEPSELGGESLALLEETGSPLAFWRCREEKTSLETQCGGAWVLSIRNRKRGTKMRKTIPFAAVRGVTIAFLAAAPADKSKTYSVTADTIEACSCPLFCTCYFGPSAMEHMCQANNVYKFRTGSHYGDVDLSNQVFWISLDLGGEWHKKPGPGMPTEWAVVTFDKNSSKA